MAHASIIDTPMTNVHSCMMNFKDIKVTARRKITNSFFELEETNTQRQLVNRHHKKTVNIH